MENGLSTSRSIGIDAIFQYTGSGVQLFSGMIFYIIAARLFSTSAVGAIAIFVAIIGLFNIIFSFGLATAAQHFTSYSLGRGDYATVRSTIYRIIFIGIILGVSGLLSLQILAGWLATVFLHSRTYTEFIRLLGIVLFGNIMYGILNGTILGIQQFRISSIISIIIWITYYFGALFFAIYLDSIDMIVFGWIIGIMLGVIIEMAVIMSSVRKYFGKGIPTSNSYLLQYSIPILLSGVISYGAAYADRFIVSGLINLSYLGIYNFSLLIPSAIAFLVIPFNNILLPKFSEFYGNGEKYRISMTAEVSSTLLSYFYVPFALGIASLSPIILSVLGGLNYIPGAMALRIIMFISALFVTQNIITQAIAATRKTKLFLYSSIFALSGNTVISIILIPPLGLIGAAIGYSSVFVITFTILYYFAKKEGLITFDFQGLLKIWMSALFMFFIVNYATFYFGRNTYLLPIYVGLGIAVYVCFTYVIGIFKRENKELILSLFPPSMRRLRNMLLVLILR